MSPERIITEEEIVLTDGQPDPIDIGERYIMMQVDPEMEALREKYEGTESKKNTDNVGPVERPNDSKTEAWMHSLREKMKGDPTSHRLAAEADLYD